MNINKNYSLIVMSIILLTLSSCERDDALASLGEIKTKNEYAQQLLSLMEVQNGSYQRFQNKLGTHTPLYDYTGIGGSEDFGFCPD